MPRKRKDDLASAVFEKRTCGMSFTAIGAAFGISKQRAQQIYNAEKKHLDLRSSVFFSLTEHTRRQILFQLKIKIEPSDVTPQIVAESLFDADLRILGDHVYTETIAWLGKYGYSVKDGFVEFEKFNGVWKAVTTHWPNGRRAPWILNRVYEVTAVNRSLARVQYSEEWFEIRLEDLKLGFTQLR